MYAAVVRSPGQPTAEQEPVVLRFAGEIDAGHDGVDEELVGAAERAEGPVVVDLVDVTFIDSSFVRALILARQAAEARGTWLRVVYTHHVIGRVIDICGLSELFPQFATVDAAARDHVVGSGEAGRSGDTSSRSKR